jgi:hypothetical protein
LDLRWGTETKTEDSHDMYFSVLFIVQSNPEAEMSRTYSIHDGDRNCIKILIRNPKRRKLLGNLYLAKGVKCRIISVHNVKSG